MTVLWWMYYAIKCNVVLLFCFCLSLDKACCQCECSRVCAVTLSLFIREASLTHSQGLFTFGFDKDSFLNQTSVRLLWVLFSGVDLGFPHLSLLSPDLANDFLCQGGESSLTFDTWSHLTYDQLPHPPLLMCKSLTCL